MCSIFSKVTQSFGFMKPNIIRKLPLKVKYISDINGDLIMHFGKFDDILKFVGMIVNDIERINSRKGTQSIVQCSKCYDNFHIILMYVN